MPIEPAGKPLRPVDVEGWVRRSMAGGMPKPLLNFEQFWDGELLVRLFDGPTPKGRRDFHINTSAEFFYQLEGSMTCTLVEDGEFNTVTCQKGEMYWIPPLVPHLNQREAGSIGLVIHTQRAPGALHGMAWYCDRCGAQVHRVDYAYERELRDLLAPKLREFAADDQARTCKRCGTVMSAELGLI
ncbi:MAG TPA: hypothetical protein VMG12_12265 [Polyangiaceae bacterium]|nr:hypothetical protein [Polyangiaceae bacterium]